MDQGLKSNLKQQSATSQKNPSYLHVKFNAAQLQSVPDVGGFYANELRERISEIQEHSQTILSSAANIFLKTLAQSKAFGQTGSAARKNGYEIAEFQKNQKYAKLLHH